MRTPAWGRSVYRPSGRASRFEMVCCSRERLTLSNGTRSDLVAWCPLNEIPMAIDLVVVADLWAGELGAELRRRRWPATRLDAALGEAIAGAEMAYIVRIASDDRDDMALLQCAWTMVRWLVGLGAFAVFDRAADCWWTAADLVGWGDHRRFSFPREVTIEQNDFSNGATEIRAIYTRGLVKMARPDLVLNVPPFAPDELIAVWAHHFRVLAERSALGALYVAGEEIRDEGLGFRFLPYRRGVLPIDPDLAEDSLVVVPEPLFDRVG